MRFEAGLSSAWVAALGVLVVACSSGAPPEPAATEERVELGPRPTLSAGLERVRRQQGAALSRSLTDLPVTTAARGGRRIALPDRMKSVHVVQRHADGTYQTECVTSRRQLDVRLQVAEALR